MSNQQMCLSVVFTSSLSCVLSKGFYAYFVLGDLAIRLQEKQGGKWASIGHGYNGYNQHYLKHNLDEGTYKLSLYLPAPVNKTDSPCSPFTFSLQTTWILQDEDVFNCDFSELPASLDSVTVR